MKTCYIIKPKGKEFVVIRCSNLYYKVNFKNSVFYVNTISEIIEDKWMTGDILFDNNCIIYVRIGGITSCHSASSSTLGVIPRMGAGFMLDTECVDGSIDNMTDYVRKDEKAAIRLGYISSRYDYVTIDYELNVLTRMLTLLKHETDNSVIQEMQKHCLLNKTDKYLPNERWIRRNPLFKYERCSPYMFFKVCEMAMKYLIMPDDKFIMLRPCMPYVEYDNVLNSNGSSISSIRASLRKNRR